MPHQQHIAVQILNTSAIVSPMSIPEYSVFIFEGKSEFWIDSIYYQSEGKTVICTTPFQHIAWKNIPPNTQLLTFEADFYCIAYHKKEVACNGLLFNAIYQNPYFNISEERFLDIQNYMLKIQKEVIQHQSFSEAIVKSYVQLILALASAEKSRMINALTAQNTWNHFSVIFQNLLERHFITQRNIDFYADKMGLSPTHFSKKIKSYFGKTPSHLIQERVTLEAKKLLHLSHQNIKEIAKELQFDDEFYFSRFFKKKVGISPLHYREKVGISIVANLSM